ncbi:MAG: hypothetical protein H6842_05455 [Rhodospirillaceae bacterium]|nr:hypothetical protein [Rhodospirillaceae bacterium]
MERLKVLAIAVATGRVGYVFLIGGNLKDWGMSRKASRSSTLAAGQTQKWIDDLRPDVVVTEKLDGSRKGEKSQGLIAAIARVAEHNYLMDVAVARIRAFENKYEEALAYAREFPEIAPWLPRKRRFFDPEPRSTVYVEALALAKQVLGGPTLQPVVA